MTTKRSWKENSEFQLENWVQAQLLANSQLGEVSLSRHYNTVFIYIIV